MRNLKLAVRTLMRTPFVTAIAIASLALGIGANSAIFSLFNQMLLRKLDAREPGMLVNLANPGPKPGSQSCGQAGDCDEVFSYSMFRDLERSNTVFSGIGAHTQLGANLAMKGETPINARGLLVSGSYFPVLGMTPALGRLLTPEDDRNIGGHYVAVLSHRFWETRLGSNPKVLNEPILVNGQSFTIVGVAPRGFDGTTLGSLPAIFIPLTMRNVVNPWFRGFENRREYFIYLFARTKPGVSVEQARLGINATYRPIITDVEAPLQEGMSDQTMAKFKTKEITLADGSRGQSSIRREARTPLTLLLGITGIVLLIACANIANLLLARAAQRSTEMAVRLSLGAGRRQLLGQLLTESVLLAVLGGAVSLLVARWTLSFIISVIPNEGGSSFTASLEPSVLLFAIGLSVATGLLFGMFPALHSTRPDLITSIRANAGQPSGARAAARFRTGLVTAQIALSMALLISAGLFVKSLANVSRVDLGIETENIVTFGVSPSLNGYNNARSLALIQRIEEELATIPGVTGVAASRVQLLAGNNWGQSVSVQGFKKNPDTDDGSRFNMAGPGYFRTLGVPLISGREFTTSDALGSPKVAIVNEAFAKKFGLGRDAVGKFMSDGGDTLDTEIVGLAQNAKYSEVKAEVPPLFFFPYRQDSTTGNMSYYVRSSLSPEALLKTIPAMIAKIDPQLPVEDLKTMPQVVKENVMMDRLISTLAAAFAALATLLAAVGLYGVLAFTVAQRTREIGVRMALGANSGQVQGMVLRQVAKMTVIGAVIGIAGALALGRAASSLLYGLSGNDPWVIVVSVVLLTLVAFGAGLIPAMRASRVHPMQALRYE
jgi:predicted permease